MKSTLEIAFDAALTEHGTDLPAPAEEFLFAKEALGRRWRFDYAWPAQDGVGGVAVEIEGIYGAKSRHRTAVGYHEDCVKYRAACILGWRVLRYTSVDLKSEPGREKMVGEIRTLLSKTAKPF